MDTKKKLFKIDEDVSNEDKPITNIIKYDELNSWESLFAMIPTPEQECENIDKESSILEEKIQELKNIICIIEDKIKELSVVTDIEKDPEEISGLLSKKEQYISILETYESDLSYNSIHKKSLGFLINDTPEDDEKFQSQIPTLLANTYISTKKKMEDVNSLVDILTAESKNRKIEQCIECKIMIKDKDGKKTALKHFHFTNFNTLEHHLMTLCVDCANKIEGLQNMIFCEDSIENSYICKRGKNILSCSIEKENEYLTSKFKEIQEIEGKMFIENINKDSKKSIFSMFFGND